MILSFSLTLSCQWAFAAATPAAEARDYQAGVQGWRQMIARQTTPCSAEVDSRALLMGKKTDLVFVILHGFSQNPGNLKDLVGFFKPYNANMLMPRLAHHYDKNLENSNNATADEWLAQARETYQVAKKLGRRVVLVGYSLGGLLASRLVLEHPQEVYALILLSPAWRVTAEISLGSLIGTLFGINGNDVLHFSPACAVGTGYISSPAGIAVERLAQLTEAAYGGSYPSPEASVFRRLNAPTFLALVSLDPTVDSFAMRTIYNPHASGYRTLLVYKSEEHGLLLTQTGLENIAFNPEESETPYPGRSLRAQIQQFLRAQLFPGSRF